MEAKIIRFLQPKRVSIRFKKDSSTIGFSGPIDCLSLEFNNGFLFVEFSDKSVDIINLDEIARINY